MIWCSWRNGRTRPPARRPAMGSAALGPASEAGIADADNPADDDQGEGGEDGGGEEPAKAKKLVRFATRGASHRKSGYGVAGSAPPLSPATRSRSGWAGAGSRAGGRQVWVRSLIARRMS